MIENTISELFHTHQSFQVLNHISAIMSDEQSPFSEMPPAQQSSPNGQVIIYQEKSSLPAVVGVLFGLSQIITILGGVAVLGVGAFALGVSDAVGDAEVEAIGAFVSLIGALITIFGLGGIVAGVMIAQRKKFGIRLAWGLLGGTVILSLLLDIYSETSINWATPLCNGICALWVGLPLMIESARVHME